MATEVVMPQMGESIAEGTITKWLKQVGDRVERDEPLFEISTDKVDAEIPSPAAGTLTEIRFKEGDTVEINTTVAVLDGESAGAATTTAPPAKAEAAADSAAQSQGSPEAPAAQQKPQAQPPETAPQQPQVEASAATGAETNQQPNPGRQMPPNLHRYRASRRKLLLGGPTLLRHRREMGAAPQPLLKNFVAPSRARLFAKLRRSTELILPGSRELV